AMMTGACLGLLAKKGRVSFRRGVRLATGEKASIGGFIEYLAQSSQAERHDLTEPRSEHDPYRHPCSSKAKRVMTKAASCTEACLRPVRTLTHSRVDSNRMRVTISTRRAVMTASRRKLNTSRASAPEAASWRACARKPIRGLGSKILS